MRNRKGFTLIELLVVITIIVILAALLLPGVNRAMQSAKVSRAEAEMAHFAITYEQVKANLPQFYYCRLEDLAEGTVTVANVRIWDTTDLAIKGQSDNEITISGNVINTLADPAKLLTNYWQGPYLTFKNYVLAGFGIGRPLDPWGHQYRMFWFTAAVPGSPTLLEQQIIPRGAVGTMIIVSAGPDGILQSCASNKSSIAQIILTAPPAESALLADFQTFDPFNQYITERDPYFAFNVVVH